MKIEAGELFVFSPETTIIEKSMSEPWRSCCATSHSSGSGLVTGEPLNTLLESVECGLGFGQGHSLLTLRNWKVVFVFSSSSWSTWPAWLLQRKNPPKRVIADVSMNLARQLTCCSGWFSETSFLWDSVLLSLANSFHSSLQDRSSVFFFLRVQSWRVFKLVILTVSLRYFRTTLATSNSFIPNAVNLNLLYFM